MKRTTILLLLLAAPLLAACGTVGKYMQNRGCDFLDIFDFKAGYGGLGLGAKVQASEYLKAGIGYGEGYRTAEFYGRRKEIYDMRFFHALLFGADGEDLPPLCCSKSMDGHDAEFLLLGSPPAGVAPLDRARFGAEIVLPGVNFGFFLNLGQLADFFAGIAGFDPADDDSLPFGEPLPHASKAPKGD